jgi:hypothetical protein
MPEVMPSPPEVYDLDHEIQDLEEEHRELLIRWRWSVGAAGMLISVIVLAVAVLVSVANADDYSLLGPICFLSFIGVTFCVSYAIDNRLQRIGIRRELQRWKLARSKILTGRATRSAEPYARYKEHLPALAEHYKMRAQRYRRIFVALQLVIIIGSLSASAITALLVSASTRYISVAVSLIVGIAASCSLTFRLRERGENLQQMGNDIECEYRAAELQIGDYSVGKDEKQRLRQLVERIETLRAEQAVKERNLEQPPDVQQSSTFGIGLE